MTIESTFCHLPGISLSDEKDYWRKGIHTWDDLLCWASVFASDARYAEVQTAIADSKVAVASSRPEFFLETLPRTEWYRVYGDFVSQLYCLDIETAGLSEDAEVTCLSILNAGRMHSFVGTDVLGTAAEVLAGIRIAVTFNGTRFDIPRLMRRFRRFLPKYHIDLAEMLRKRKIRGSLDAVANSFGWVRDDEPTTIANGEDAACAWAVYQRTGDRCLLRELRSYNQQDVNKLDFLLRSLVRHHARSCAL